MRPEKRLEPSPQASTEAHNFAVLALHGVLVRVAWIFKTETVILPAFLDSIAGAGWLRGLLPVLNRTGQSIPVFLGSARLEQAQLKKRGLFWGTLLQGACFAGMAGAVLTLTDTAPQALAWVFLAIYTVFFSVTGVSNVLQGTLQGKLVPAGRRGRLIAASTFGGTVPAVLFAWWLLPGWLEREGGADFASIFGFTAGGFALAALLAPTLREHAASSPPSHAGVAARLSDALAILRNHRPYRRLVVSGALFNSSILLMPHYQALGRDRLGLGGVDLLFWVTAQHVALGMASLVAGPLADRHGNRLALRVVSFGAAGVPLLAVALTHLELDLGRALFPLVFVGLGLTPIGLRILTNYTLELNPPDEHPRYLATGQVVWAAAFCLSPLVGGMIDEVGFDRVFLAASLAVSVGGVLTFGLTEPRETGHPPSPRAP